MISPGVTAMVSFGPVVGTTGSIAAPTKWGTCNLNTRTASPRLRGPAIEGVALVLETTLIVFGVCAADSDNYERHARPGIERSAEPGSRTIVLRSQPSLAAGYNEIARQARAHHDLEALILIHDDVEIADVNMCSKIRALLDDPSIGVVGALGGRGVTSLRYWESETFGHVAERTDGITRQYFGETRGGTHDVDMVDGLLLALSPTVVRNIPFDERTFRAFNGYGGDLCAQVKASGLRVVVTDLELVHHPTYTGRKQVAFLRADMLWRSKWAPVAPWRRRLFRIRAAAAPIEYDLRYRGRATRRWIKAKMNR
jgi:hypothetical protein